MPSNDDVVELIIKLTKETLQGSEVRENEQINILKTTSDSVSISESVSIEKGSYPVNWGSDTYAEAKWSLCTWGDLP